MEVPRQGIPVTRAWTTAAGWLAALLARIAGPPSGNHHAIPETPAGPPACPPSWDGCSAGSITLLDFRAARVPPYVGHRAYSAQDEAWWSS